VGSRADAPDRAALHCTAEAHAAQQEIDRAHRSPVGPDRQPRSPEQMSLLLKGPTRGSLQVMLAHHAEPGDLEMIHGTQEVLGLLAGRWSVDVLYLLASGTRRYSQIFYEVGEISKKTLTQTLRTLEAKDLIARRAFAEVPLRVEYSWTRRGWSLSSLLMAMYEWAAQDGSMRRTGHLRLAA
jgi:DNA-binding HxlR family transcriptional regulator